MATQIDDKVQELTKRLETRRGEARVAWTAFAKIRDEVAGTTDATDTESEGFKRAEEAHMAYATIADDIAKLETARDGWFRLTGTGGQGQELAAQANAGEIPGSREVTAWGQRIAEMDAYRQISQGDLAAFTGRVMLGEVANRAELHALVTGASDTSAGAFITADRIGLVSKPEQPLFLTDLITVGQTDSDLIEYVVETGFTNNAAFVAEATKDGPISASDPVVTAVEAGLKPQSALAFAVKQTTVKTIAHWVAITRRALADEAQMRTYIDGRLRYGIQVAVQTQMMQGDGTGENLLGLLNTPGVQSQSKASDTMVDALHKAMTKVRLAFHEPAAAAIHPQDWEAIRLAKDTTGQYLYGPPALAGAQTVWGLPAVAQAVVPAGNPIVGDFRQAHLWLREGIQVLASDSHVDFFTRNIVALLAEMRVAFGVLTPEAFCEVVA